MFTVRPLTVKIKESVNPVEMFLRNELRVKKFMREICFYRLIGSDHQDDSGYLKFIMSINESLLNQKDIIPSLRLNDLKKVISTEDTTRHSEFYDRWYEAKDRTNEEQFLVKFPIAINNNTLEWTIRLAYKNAVNIYERFTQNVTKSMVKNFGIKLFYWIETYVPEILTKGAQDLLVFPKVLFVGNIKKQESIFLYFLASLGCDILYINPLEDIPDTYKDIMVFSKLYVLGKKKDIKVPNLSELSPVKNKKIPEKHSETFIPYEPKPIVLKEHSKELSFEELANLSPCIVMIEVLDNMGNLLKTGSGVIISDKGYILTNCHVIREGSEFSIRFENDNNPCLTGHLIKYNYDYDLAVLKIDKRCNPINIFRNGKLVRGQKVVAIGSPFGLFNSISDGIISGFRKKGVVSMIQFTAPISGGSSGGALLDMYGSLIGISTSSLVSVYSDGFIDGQNLNFAVSYEIICDFLGNLIT